MNMKIILIGLFIILFESFLTISYGQVNFEARTLDGEKLEILELVKSGPVLINFWATWCQPCKAEMKHLKSLFEKYKQKGLSIIGINQDSPKSLAKVKSFIASNKVDYPIVLDPNNQIFQKFNGQVMPYSILINSRGEIEYKHTGYLAGDEVIIENEIKKLLTDK